MSWNITSEFNLKLIRHTSLSHLYAESSPNLKESESMWSVSCINVIYTVYYRGHIIECFFKFTFVTEWLTRHDIILN